MKSLGDHGNITPEEYRGAIGHLASGVSVISTEVNGKKFGLTASAVTSLALEPPMLIVCINKSTGSAHAIKESQKLGVNVLSLDQSMLARQFATPNIDKFADVELMKSHLEVPLLKGAHVNVECEVESVAEGGTHYIFIANVRSAQVNEESEPLVYYRGKFGEYVSEKGNN